MDVEDYLLLFLAVWLFLSAVFAGSVDVFLTLALIGLLITIEVGSLFMGREQKKNLKPLVELLLLLFTLVVLKKIYTILSG
ncbi:hypothetical protein [Thermococcus sp.]